MADYGKDIYQLSPQIKKLASGVVGVFRSECLTLLDNGAVAILCDPAYPEKLDSEKVKEWAHGSGFLVGKSLLATAGHVLGNLADEILGKHFLLGYQTHPSGIINLQFSPAMALEAESLVDSKNFQLIDYALLSLNQSAPPSAEILEINEQDSLTVGEEVFVIGHPEGLPTKYSGPGKVTEVMDDCFTINLEIYEHHSGSPVFNVQTGKVEGIVFNADGQCFKICKLTDLIRNQR
jgi:V8-like Glu-specific endopeptidase